MRWWWWWWCWHGGGRGAVAGGGGGGTGKCSASGIGAVLDYEWHERHDDDGDDDMGGPARNGAEGGVASRLERFHTWDWMNGERSEKSRGSRFFSFFFFSPFLCCYGSCTVYGYGYGFRFWVVGFGLCGDLFFYFILCHQHNWRIYFLFFIFYFLFFIFYSHSWNWGFTSVLMDARLTHVNICHSVFYIYISLRTYV